EAVPEAAGGVGIPSAGKPAVPVAEAGGHAVVAVASVVAAVAGVEADGERAVLRPPLVVDDDLGLGGDRHERQEDAGQQEFLHRTALPQATVTSGRPVSGRID